MTDSAALAVLKEVLPVLQRASKHYDCEDCWYSCSTLTCDDGRRSDECDCGAAEAIVALRQVEALIVTLEADHAASFQRCPYWISPYGGDATNVPHEDRLHCILTLNHQGDHVGDERFTGLHHKYDVTRRNDPTGKHAHCRYFVLDPQHDPIAREALRRYAQVAAERGYDQLAMDLRRWVDGIPVGA